MKQHINSHLLFYSVAYTELDKELRGYLKIGIMGLQYVGPADELLIGHVILAIQEKGIESLWKFKGFKNEYKSIIIDAFFAKDIDLNNTVDYNVSLQEINKVSKPGEILSVSETMFQKSQLHTSSNYRQFLFLPFNRPVSKKHVMEIIESMDEFGNLSTCVMVITKCITGYDQIFIADGQHRFSADEMTGRPVYFHLIRIEDKATLVRLISKLNATSRRWAIKDYLRAWCSLDIEEYINIEKQIKKTRLPVSALLEAYSGLNRNAATKLFMDGRFPSPDMTRGNMLVDQVMDLHRLSLAPWNRQFLGCAIRFLRNPEYHYDILKEKLLNNKIDFSKNEADITKQLFEIYES
jgi:hypothetical protein